MNVNQKNLNQAKVFFENGLENLLKSNYSEAEKYFLKSLKIIPNRISTISNLIQIYFLKKEINKLNDLLNSFLYLQNDQEIQFGYACLNHLKGEYDISITLCKKIIQEKINIDENKVINLLAINYRKIKNFLQSIKHYKIIFKKKKDYLTFYNIASLLSEIGKNKFALNFYLKCKELKPEFKSCLWNLSHCYLKLGKLDLGFNLYENRFLNENPVPKKFEEFKDVKSIDELAGKKVLIWDEQGLGDTINFSRFVVDLLYFTKNITFVVNHSLVELLENLNENINVVDYDFLKTNPQEFDYQISLGSLPRLLKIKNKNELTFRPLILKEEKINLPKDRLNIGLTWFGNVNYPNDEYRSIALKYFKEILSIKNINYYKLSKGIKDIDLDEYNRSEIQDLGNKNFNQLSKYLMNLDLIISSDTVIAHLAGILNLNCILLLNFNSDWRWFYDDKKTPWYPSIKIIKQKKLNDWGPVFSSLKNELEIYLNKKIN